MTAAEITVLEALSGLEDRGWTPTARDIADEVQARGVSCTPRFAGYHLRALEERGHVGHEGRRHGGAWKWGLRLSGAQVLAA